MQVTYRLPVEWLNEGFLETIRTQFAGKEINITVEEVESAMIDPIERFQKMEKLRKKLKRIKVDPDVDLSALANEVNL